MYGLRKWNVKIFYHVFLTDKDIATAVPRHLYSTLKPEQTSCLIPVPHCRRDVVSLFYWRSSRSYGGKEWKRMTGAAPNTDEAYNVPVLKLRIQPSWDARFCMSRGFAPSIKQWLTQVETQYFASHKQPCRKLTRYNIAIYNNAFTPRETQNLASLQGLRHQYKILLTLLMRYFMPYPYVPSSLAIRTFWLSAKVLFGLYIVFFYIFPMKIK